MIPSTTPPAFPETAVLQVGGQNFKVRFLAQADTAHDAGATASDAHAPAATDAHEPTPAGDGAHGEDAHAAPAGDAAGHGDAHADAHAEAGHGEGHGEAHVKTKYEVPEELPNIYTIANAYFSKGGGHHEGGHHAPWWVNPCFSFFYAALLVVVLLKILRNLSVDRPGKGQVAVESIFSGLAGFFGDIVGPENIRKYVPFLGSLWLFILLNNWFTLIPLFKSPTAHFQTTVGLGICVFCFVNFHGMKAGGVGHYFWHLCGSPQNAVGWVMAPLMLVLETVGTLVKPVSLSLRLYGNIFGEDKLLAIFLGLGMSISAALLHTATPPVGIPLHLPFLFLSVLLGMIQATVFSMLSAVYIALLLPHHDHEHEHEHGAAHAEHGEEAHAKHA